MGTYRQLSFQQQGNRPFLMFHEDLINLTLEFLLIGASALISSSCM